ncbi:MAG: TVP38/TMEM64 family protein [Anaerolineae bacterium]
MKSRVFASLALVVLALLTAVFLLICHWDYWILFQDQTRLRAWINQWGAWKPLAVIFLQMAQVLLAPIPGQVVGLVSGYFFGVFWGTFYSMIGTILGSIVAFTLARIGGRPLVERLMPTHTLQHLDEGARRHGLFFFLLVFLAPFLPDDLACFVAGLSPIPIPALTLVAIFGRLPGSLISCWLGANAIRFNITQWFMLGAASVLLAVLFLRYGNQLQEWAWKITGNK